LGSPQIALAQPVVVGAEARPFFPVFTDEGAVLVGGAAALWV
jgi:hypothetical protein